jgi:N-carbamoylputrescine amidase
VTLCRVAVTESDPELRPRTEAWSRLIRDLERARPDLFVLNELSFGPWIAAKERFDPDLWKASVEAHEDGVAALGELGVPVITGSRSIELGGRRCNEAYVWTAEAGARGVHTKQHIPNSPGYRETTWYERGEQRFEIADAGPLKIGFLICTDIMFNEHARHYGRQGADLIVSPRAMPPLASHFFDVALQLAAVTSGCYVASSNRGGTDSAGEPFEGRGCIVNPLGETVAQTSSFSRVAFHDIDTDFVAWKKTVYPCNVAE